MLEKIKKHSTVILVVGVSLLATATAVGLTYTLTAGHYSNRIEEMNEIAQRAGVLDKLVKVQNEL